MIYPNTKFFLGSKTQNGFVPLFEYLRNMKDGTAFYILKGGPGSGKSSLMKKIGLALEEKGDSIEYIFCASDPNSLDAIVDEKRKIVIMDGTPPHGMDGKCIGAYDHIFNTGDAWDTSILKENKEKIINLNNKISFCHRKATAYISSAMELLDFSDKETKQYIDYPKISSIVNNFLQDFNLSSVRGNEKKRLLSAVSVGEIVFFDSTLDALTDKIYCVYDNYGGASQELFTQLKEKALARGIDIITCYSSVNSPKQIDHLIIPKLRLAFSRKNIYHSFTSSKIKEEKSMKTLYKKIPDKLEESLEIMEKNAIEIFSYASKSVKEAKILHDDLENIYSNAMNFSKLDEMTDKLLKEILNKDCIL